MPDDKSGRHVGLVGLGAMGAPMARRLAAAGHRLALYDIDAGKAAALAEETGGIAAGSLPELAAQCDLVITMLPNSRIVREALIGSEQDPGVGAGLARGATVVDMSSSSPIVTRELGAELARRGVALLDAPVSGGVGRAKSGTLAIMLGGDDDGAMDRATPVLEALGTLYRVGGLGNGHALKALNNYVSAAGLAAACEALIVGEAFGLDPERMVDVLNVSTGRNNSTENKLKPFVITRQFRSAGFTMELMAKDIGLAADLAEELGLHMSGLQAARSLWQDAYAALGKGTDHTEIFRYLAGER